MFTFLSCVLILSLFLVSFCTLVGDAEANPADNLRSPRRKRVRSAHPLQDAELRQVWRVQRPHLHSSDLQQRWVVICCCVRFGSDRWSEQEALSSRSWWWWWRRDVFHAVLQGLPFRSPWFLFSGLRASSYWSCWLFPRSSEGRSFLTRSCI